MAPLTLISTGKATTYSFRAAPGEFGWACCTVNDTTGEFNITSDWGNFSYRWDPRPSNLGAPTLTAFIGTRGDVDYIARKLQNEGRDGQVFSGEATAKALRAQLRKRRLEDGRRQWENRLDYDEQGRPLLGNRYVDAPTWNDPYLTKSKARTLWNDLGEVGRDCDRHRDLFYERVLQVDGFTDYVTEEPWEYAETEQTPQDRALRELVLPALIKACGEPERRCTCHQEAGDSLCEVHPPPAEELAYAKSIGAPYTLPCTNYAPAGFTGHWREWHRGHGCDKDDGKPRTEGAP